MHNFRIKTGKGPIQKSLFRIISYFILISCCLILPEASFAGVDLPWSTTFNCTDWTYPGSLTCDGLVNGYDNPCTGYSGNPNKGEQISASANYPYGGGGKGQIHYLGHGQDNDSGGVFLKFNTPQKELWMRYYIKYDSSLVWSGEPNYQKQVYINPGGYANAFVVQIVWADTFRVSDGTHNWISSSGWGWASKFSDRKWHCVEWHAKLHSAAGNDGIVQVWIDGTKIIDVSNAQFGGSYNVGWHTLWWGSNMATLSNNVCSPVYYDDMAVSNTGRIGCLSGTGPIALVPPPVPPIVPPTGLKIIP